MSVTGTKGDRIEMSQRERDVLKVVQSVVDESGVRPRRRSCSS